MADGAEPRSVKAMAFSTLNSRGKKYYLHKKGRIYFFSTRSEGAVDKPEGYEVVENLRTGLPLLKRKP